MAETMSSREKTRLEFPIVFTAQEAAQVAEVALYEQWFERWIHTLETSIEFVKLNPTDVITVTYDGVTHTLRIVDIQQTETNRLQIKAVPTASYLYTGVAAGVQGLGFLDQTLKVNSPTVLYLLDIPMLRDDDDDAGFYIAATGTSPANWSGALIYKSTDGLSYANMLPVFTGAQIGSAITVLASGSYTVWDTANTVDVIMTSGSLSSTDSVSVINGANTALLGSEIVSWQTATDNGDGTYTLSNLLRGRQGSEWAVGSHSIGERCIILSTNGSIRRLRTGSNEINVARWYKGVSIGQAVEVAQVQPFTNTAVGLECYAPAHVAGSRDGSNNLTITWVRRTRKGGIVRDFKDVPLSEETESYEVDIMSGATVLRTIAVTSETASYSAAEQTTDGLTPGDPIEVNIYQLSATVGRGYATNATI